MSRERHLHRAANDAYRNGELSVAQLLDVLCHRNGWDPSRHPIEQETTLRLIARERTLRAYRTASDLERAAWQAADVAAASKHSLDAEAYTAAAGTRVTRPDAAKVRTNLRLRSEITAVLPTLAAIR